MKIPRLADRAMQQPELLAITQEPLLARSLKTLAESNQWKLDLVITGWKAMEFLDRGEVPGLIVLDLPRNLADNLYLLQWLRRFHAGIPVVAICAADDLETKLEASRLGADRFLLRPFSEQQIESVIHAFMARELASDEERFTACDDESFRVSSNPGIRKLCAHAELLGNADVPVLIVGEKGVGKEGIARLIHKLSESSGGMFHKLDCAITPDKLVEQEIFGDDSTGHLVPGSRPEMAGRSARKTLFLNHLACLPHAIQTKLARELQQQISDRNEREHLSGRPRILAAMDCCVDDPIPGSQLAEGLFYPFSAFIVRVPSLRDRKEEIPGLLRYSMIKLAKYYGQSSREFPSQLVMACQDYAWPGNLNELDVFVKYYLYTGDTEARPGQRMNGAGSGALQVNSSGALQTESDAGSSIPKSLKNFVRDVKWQAEKSAIGAALQKTGWNRKAASRLLNVSYRTLLYKIEQHKIKAPNSATESRASVEPEKPVLVESQEQHVRG